MDIFPKGLTDGFCLEMAIFPTLIFLAILARKMSFRIFYNEKTPFQAIKTKCSKSRNIDLFAKGLTHGFEPKMAIFGTFFQVRKMCFTKFQNGKTPFQGVKTRSAKTQKIEIFPKGLNHGFGPKMPFFGHFSFQAIQARKRCFTIFQNEKTLF